MVPMSLRGPDQVQLPSVNIVSAVFLDRKKREMAGDPQKLLEGIHREMEWVKRHDQKFVFVLVLHIGRKLGGFLSADSFADDDFILGADLRRRLAPLLALRPEFPHAGRCGEFFGGILQKPE